MPRPWNFGAGPAMLPEAVLERAQQELTDWQGSGVSVLEMGHREAPFTDIARRVESHLRELLAIPAHYRVLFLQGGARAQFAAVPLNLTQPGHAADYIESGYWSRQAMAEARPFCRVNIGASGSDSGWQRIPPMDQWRLSPDAAYCHYTPNETIDGLEFHWTPETGEVPLVADMTSSLLTRPIEVERFGVIYAAAQKNLGIAGLTILIIREDLLAREGQSRPAILDYARQAQARSMVSTPPTFAWYIAGLMLEWIQGQGGLTAMAHNAESRAEALYACIDASGFYRNGVDPRCRSRVNIPFTLAKPVLNQQFIDEALEAGLINLAGHRSVGGMRASLYNAVAQSAVRDLIAFMQTFEQHHG